MDWRIISVAQIVFLSGQLYVHIKRRLNGFCCVSCCSAPKVGRQRTYNHSCFSFALAYGLPQHRFLKSGARLGIMPKELKGFPYRISLKVLQIYGEIFIRAPFPWAFRTSLQLPRSPRLRFCSVEYYTRLRIARNTKNVWRSCIIHPAKDLAF